MRHFIAILCTALALAILPAAGRADDEQIKAINAAIAALDAAFEQHDEAAIRRLTTPDHIAVTPYYGGPQPLAQSLASLKDYKVKQTMLSEPKVTMLGSDVAVRTSIAKFEGTFQGKPVPPKMFVTEIVVRRDGRWVEMLYQMTPIGQ